MNAAKTRASLYIVVAGYLLYQAYGLYQGRNDPDTTMSPAVMVLFIALFVLAALGLAVFAVYTWRQSAREDKERQDENNLK